MKTSVNFKSVYGPRYDGQGVYCGLSAASEVFLFLLPNYIHVYAIIMQ